MANFDGLSEDMRRKRQITKGTLNYSERVFNKLNTVTNWSGDHAMFLGNLCQKFDEEYGLGSHLALDWMLDNYLGFELERNVFPAFQKIYDKLVAGNHIQSNPFEIYDGEVFYVKNKKYKIIVEDFRGNKNLMIFDDREFSKKFYVRKVWSRNGKNCIGTVDKPSLAYYKKRNFEMRYANSDHAIYGDARDAGHILTYENMFPEKEGHGTCDKALWHLQDALHWIFRFGCVKNEMEES